MKNYNKEELDVLKARAYAHGCEKEGVFIALNRLNREEITKEQKEQANRELEHLKKEMAWSYERGEFRLCPMWSEKEGDFNNYRARAELIAKNWDRIFIEFQTRQPKGEPERLHVSTCNLTEEDFHNYKLQELKKKNRFIERHRRSQEDQEERNKRMKQPYYHHDEDKAREFLKDKPATRETALNLINYLYWTEFKSLVINDLIEPERVNRD